MTPTPPASRPVRCVVAGGSLVGLSAAIALSRLGLDVTVAEQSPAAVTPGDEICGSTVLTADGGCYAADLVIGADGARSTVRVTVDPQHPLAQYAGVLLWRTMVGEEALPREVTLPRAGEPAREVYAGPYRLVTYPVPGPAGGDRRRAPPPQYGLV
jgi:2-polyprenyl-6-methoxyphenol hydroxylase-like FAD-dependent oxidoreductase